MVGYALQAAATFADKQQIEWSQFELFKTGVLEALDRRT